MASESPREARASSWSFVAILLACLLVVSTAAAQPSWIAVNESGAMDSFSPPLARPSVPWV